MHESLQQETPIEIITCDLSSSQRTRVLKALNLEEGSVTAIKLSQFHNHPKASAAQLIIVNNMSADFEEKNQILKKIKESTPSIVIIVVDNKINIHQFSKMVNEVKVFAILDEEDDVSEISKKALKFHASNADRYKNLKNLKKQNNQLESLNQNLEIHVHERTKKEFEANKQTEQSLKNIQSLLAFIKSISRTENIEDFMSQMRIDFKKYHGLMPPILLLLSPTSVSRIFYYQGKQFTERKVNIWDRLKTFKDKDVNSVRSEMSHLLGRPFGQVNLVEFPFKSPELEHYNAKLVFEHSLDESDLTYFLENLKERTSLMNMALENILLKESLQNIAKQWAKTFNEMKDPIVILDQNYKITLSNSYYEKEIAHLLTQPANEKLKQINNSILEKTFLAGTPQATPLSFMGRVFKVHSYPIRLENSDQVSHVINQYVDITQFVDLQSKVIQGEKMAAVGLLAGNIAHELNNPLTGIFSLSQLLLEDFDKNSNTYKDLHEVKDAAARCQRIIKDLLEFSNFGSDAKIKKIDLSEVVSKTMPLLKMATRTLNTDLQLNDEPIFVQSNPQLLQQVVFNLVNNACQAMDDGGFLYVITEKTETMGRILIRDTGPGIPESIRDSIFDPFFTTKEEDKGTGLGLSMSKSVIERYKGTLTLNTDYTEGTEFIISLPLVINENSNC